MFNLVQLDADQLQEWLASDSDTPRLIQIYAEWCIYHLLTEKKILRLADRIGVGCRIGRFDIVGQEDVARRLGYSLVPTIIYRRGQTVLHWVGDTDLDVMIESIHVPQFSAEPQ